MINKTIIVAIRNVDNEFFASTSKTQIANFLNISVGTVHRVLVGTNYYSCNSYQIKTGVPLGTMNRHGVVNDSHTKTLDHKSISTVQNSIDNLYMAINDTHTNNIDSDTESTVTNDVILDNDLEPLF